MARIYEANNDAENAVKNYERAIVNQPEMPQLYEAIANLETKRGKFDEALKQFGKILELTNDAPEFVKKKIEILKKAGRFDEIKNEQAKLPAETKNPIDEFAEARNLAATEREKAREIYKSAWQKFQENPLQSELKIADIAGYVETVRDEESLDKISKNLWDLREQFVLSVARADISKAGLARARMAVLDSAIIESIGAIAKQKATDEELKNLHDDWENKLMKAEKNEAGNKMVELIQNLANRAGFGDLEEKILIRKIEAESIMFERNSHLQRLIEFYNSRGAFQKTFKAIEKYDGRNFEAQAEISKLSGEKEKELENLRKIYWRADEIATENNEYVGRYLEILRAEKRDELKSLTEKNSIYQLQLINFLLGAGEREFAHSAIKNSAFSDAWKVSRNAETSLALREFDENSECYFCNALQLDSIENLMNQTPDKQSFLINDDWFRLAREYGEWLLEKSKSNNENTIQADKFLPAMIENLPESADEQFKLGAYYLGQNNYPKAIEHLKLSIETENAAIDDKRKLSTLGAAYFKLGSKDMADKLWLQVIENKELEDAIVLIQTLQKYELSSEARKIFPNIIIKFLSQSNADNSEEFRTLIKAVSTSFTSEKEKTAYFLQIMQQRPTDKSLGKMLIKENLIDEKNQAVFYELLLNRTEQISDYDYQFQTVSKGFLSNQSEVESVYDAEKNYKIEEPENERYKLQKTYCEYLIKRGENAEAERIISQIESELSNNFARPDWLRLTKIRLQIRRGKFDSVEAKRFIGIEFSDAAKEIKLPSVERLNEILRVLREENLTTEISSLNEEFFARMLAMENFSTTNLIGLARVFANKKENEKALQVIHLAVDTADNKKREETFAQISELAEVIKHQPDAAKIAVEKSEKIQFDESEILNQISEFCIEIGASEIAVELRRKLLEAKPNDSENRFKLAEILLTGDRKNEALDLFREIVNSKNSTRNLRWQARMILREQGENTDFPNEKFDAYSQFYNGIIANQNGQKTLAEEYFINALIADKSAEKINLQPLVKVFTELEKPFAAIILAETDKSVKSDELLDILTKTAENAGEFFKAVEFEKAKTDGGNVERIKNLQNLNVEKTRRATDFRVDKNNTRTL